MKFDSSAIPILPTQAELIELNDLLLAATELYQAYSTLERHPRVLSSAKSLELFTSCREQLHQDVTLIDKQMEILLSLTRSNSTSGENKSTENQALFAHQIGTDSPSSFPLIPDVEPLDINKSVFEIVSKCFHTEDAFSDLLNSSLRSAQKRKHLKLELQLKMIILSADQRGHPLEDRYGYARSKNLLFQGLRRQTTRFLSALSGENRSDIDR